MAKRSSKSLAVPHNSRTDLERDRGAEYRRKAERLFTAALSQKSKATIRAYEESLANLAKFLDAEDSKAALGMLIGYHSRLDAELRVLEYIGWMQDQGLSPSTIRLRLSAIKFYIKTAYRAQWVDWTLDTEGPPQENVKEVEGPTPKQFKRILAVVDDLDGAMASRNRCMVYMLSFMALRISECLSLDMEHVDLERKTIAVKRKGSRVKRERRTIPHKTFEYLQQWIEVRGRGAGPLFSTSGQGRLHRSTAYKIIRKIGAMADVPTLHPHAFRHFSTTEALEVTGKNTRETMKHTGHKSERMVSIYEDKRADVAGDIAQRIEDRWMEEE